MKKEEEITCTIELTEGAEKRLTEAFVDLYYGIRDGIYAGPLPGNLPERINRRKPGTEDKLMDQTKIDRLYDLLDRAEREQDSSAAAALRWAIIEAERRTS